MRILFSRGRRVLQIAGTLLGLTLLIYQIVTSLRHFDELPSQLDRIDLILLGLLLCVAANFLYMTAWKVLLSGLGFDIPFASLFFNFYLSFISRYIPGTVWGYLSRNEWLKRDHQLPYSITNLGSLIETAGNVLSTLIVMLVGVSSVLSPYFSLLLVFLFFIGSWAALNLTLGLKNIQKLLHIQPGTFRRFPLSVWGVIVALYTGMWFCYGSGLAVFGSSVSPTILYSQVLWVSAIYACAWLIGFVVPFLPSGLGLREYSLTFLLTAWYGLLQPQASIIAVGFRLLVSIAELVWIVIGSIKKVNLWFVNMQIKK